MAAGQVLEDRRTDREELVKSFSVFLSERKIDHCELHYAFPRDPQSNVSLHARMRLDYFGQGADMNGDNKISMAYRIVQERDRTDFVENEVTMIRCTTFLSTNLSPARVPVSVLLDALGPIAVVTK
jgi:hypothetical protein